MKKMLPTLILVGVVYLWYFFSHQPSHPQSLHVLGANTNIQLFTEPQDGKQPLLDAIQNAQKEILVEVYLLSDKQVIQALEDAQNRGVSVKVMLEQHPFGGVDLNTKTQQELTSHHVAVSWTNPAFSLTHEKAIVIDGSETFILNQNLTAASFTHNREYDILDTNLQDVSEVRAIFIADWQRTSYSVPTTHLIVSPKTSRAALTTLISSATKTIQIEIEDINDPSIVSLLSQKAKTVQIDLLIPTISQVASNKNAVTTLAQDGVTVKTLSSPYIHAKLILVDGSKAYVGSVNLSSQSMDENRELGIILTQNDSVTTLANTFASDFAKGKSLLGNE